MIRKIRIRSFLLGFAECLIVLGLAGCAGSSGGKAASRGPKVWRPSRPGASGPALAVVAGRRITMLDVDSVLASAPAGMRDTYTKDPELLKVLVDRIVQQEAIYLAAVKAGAEKDSAYQADVEAQRRQLLMKHYYQKVSRSIPAVSDSAVRQYYEAHTSELSMPGRTKVRHIQVPTQAKAREVLKQLRSNSWDQVCARYSTDKVTAKSGGVVGYATSDTELVPGIGNAPSIVAAAFKLKVGETSEPLKNVHGWHIIRVDEKTEAGPRPLEQVKAQIRETLEGEQSEHFQTAWVDSLKRVYGVTVYADSIDVAMKGVSSPAQLFAKAQATASPKERIDLFRAITTQYPEDKSAVQATFMIGFTYAEELKDYPAAHTAFEEFIKKYPKSDLVASAKWMLENMEHSAPPPSVGTPDTLLLVPGGPGGMNTKP